MKPDKSLSLDDPADEALAETWKLLDGTAQGGIAFVWMRQTLRDIRSLPEVLPP